MINIVIPPDFIPEREYIIETLFGEFLGLQFQIKSDLNAKEYTICLENGRKLVIEDHFFLNLSGDFYLAMRNIPREIFFLEHPFCPEKDIPVLYGTGKIDIRDGGICCGIDILAGSFFMLARWEEHVSHRRDEHYRFTSKDSLAGKEDFLHRPVVNEYVEMLWSMLEYLQIQQDRKERVFEFIPTHDVDSLYCWKGFPSLIGTMGIDLIQHGDLPAVCNDVKSFFLTKLKIQKDPFDVFENLIDFSTQNKVKSHFFFMAGGSTKYDRKYSISDPFFRKLLQHIDESGHIIGFHPSYNSFNNADVWEEEFNALQEVSPQRIVCGRQHYLRFEVPYTWQIWDDHNFEWDSTLSYASQEGFRCGVCHEYSVFNFIARKKLKLKERPLTVMEGSLINYQNISPDSIQERVSTLMNCVKRYRGQFVLLWHNSSFFNRYQAYSRIYKSLFPSRNDS